LIAHAPLVVLQQAPRTVDTTWIVHDVFAPVAVATRIRYEPALSTGNAMTGLVEAPTHPRLVASWQFASATSEIAVEPEAVAVTRNACWFALASMR
jgi:hypothetical protein